MVGEGNNTSTIFIGQLPRFCEESDLVSLFSEFGKIERISFVKDKNTNERTGCAFLTYSNEASALSATKMNKMNPFATVPLNVRMAPLGVFQETKLYVSKLAQNTDEERLKSIFSKYGEVAEVHLLRLNNSPQSKGTNVVSSRCSAFVKYNDPTSAQKAIEELHEKFVDGSSPIIVKLAYTKTEKEKFRQNLEQKDFLSSLQSPIMPRPQLAHFQPLPYRSDFTMNDLNCNIASQPMYFVHPYTGQILMPIIDASQRLYPSFPADLPNVTTASPLSSSPSIENNSFTLPRSASPSKSISSPSKPSASSISPTKSVQQPHATQFLYPNNNCSPSYIYPLSMCPSSSPTSATVSPQFYYSSIYLNPQFQKQAII